MILGKKLVVIMPAYNAARTLRQTYEELPHEYMDEVILVDDASKDETGMLARELGIKTVIHLANTGYGGNQKTCYREALMLGADIVVMVHPDYQYSPRLVAAMASMVTSGHYDVVLGSRILGGTALKSGMPLYIYRQQTAHPRSKHGPRRQALGVPYGLSRLYPGSAGDPAA